MLTASSALHIAARMPRRPKNSLGPLILYHGCDREIAEAVLSGKETLQPSENDYDWLGPGIYFWVDSPDRALDWAKDRKKRLHKRWEILPCWEPLRIQGTASI